MPTFIKSEKGDALPLDYEKQMQASFDWLKDWVSKRTGMKNPQGQPLISQQEAARLVEEVNKLRIYEGKHTVELIKRDVQSGKITGINSQDLKPGSSFLREIQETLEGYDRVGGFIGKTKDPAVVINSSEVRRQTNLDSTPQRMAFGALSQMTKDQAAQIGKIQQQSGDFYLPNMQKADILSQLNELRYNFNLDPLKQYTEADVAKMRAISDKNSEVFIKQYETAISKDQKPPMKPRQIIPESLERLSNKEISNLLNNVAQELNIKPREGLDLEHNTAETLLADQSVKPSHGFKPQTAAAPKVEVSEHLRTGRHMV